MKEKMKGILLHIIVGIVVLVGALVFFNYQASSEKGQDFSEMANSTFPVMEIRAEHGDYDVMFAYIDDVDLSLVRNQIAVVEKDRKIQLCLHNYNYDITAIQYELFIKNQDNLVEEGTLNKLEESEEEGVRTATIEFENKLDKGKNYYLKLTTRLNNDTKVFYYTKLINAEGCHFNECLDFAMNFHDNLFNKENFEQNITYLEPSGKPSKTLENVDITSSVDAISFGNMKVKKECDPKLTVREINEVYSVLQLDYILSSEIKEGVIQYYNVQENYKIRYTSDRMYLLDYNRSMDAYYNKTLYDPAKNYITLGIANISNIGLLSSDSGYKVCFSQAGQLWYYNYNSSDVAKVYSFSSENLGDVRNTQSNHGIKILRMDDGGNIIYIVYGYMNRGRFEGRNGIQLLRYNAANRCNEEMAFFSTTVSYEQMREDVDKLTYLNSKNIFYCLLDGDLHAVDIVNNKDTILHSGMINENITAAAGENIIAVEEEKDLTVNRKIRMIDLETGNEKVFTCEENQRIRSVGFLANDFIYGIASTSNISKMDGGTIIFPMEQLNIVNIDGTVLKNYSKANRYIMQTKTMGSVLEMTFGEKVGKTFQITSDIDYIRYKEAEKSGEVSVVYDYSTRFWNQAFLRFPNYVYIQIEPDLIMTKVLSSEKNVVVDLERSNEAKTMYYVYQEGKEQGSYDNLRNAILEADECRGKVISSEEETMWECGFVDYAMVAGMDHITKVKTDKNSLTGCLEMIAKVNGKQADYTQIVTNGKDISELVADYSGKEAYSLEGCTLDEILYFVSKGSPVLAKYNNKRYVIIMSYNSTKVRYIDPVAGISTAVDRKGLEATLTKAGNKFYTYSNE